MQECYFISKEDMNGVIALLNCAESSADAFLRKWEKEKTESCFNFYLQDAMKVLFLKEALGEMGIRVEMNDKGRYVLV